MLPVSVNRHIYKVLVDQCNAESSKCPSLTVSALVPPRLIYSVFRLFTFRLFTVNVFSQLARTGNNSPGINIKIAIWKHTNGKKDRCCIIICSYKRNVRVQQKKESAQIERIASPKSS